jgi:hypothetical protein
MLSDVGVGAALCEQEGTIYLFIYLIILILKRHESVPSTIVGIGNTAVNKTDMIWTH